MKNLSPINDSKDVVTKELLDGKANSSHTHNYAGSSSSGGAATSAVALTSNAGSATSPIYFSGGKPVACQYTLGKSVPSNAVFTDTVTDFTLSTGTVNGNVQYNKSNGDGTAEAGNVRVCGLNNAAYRDVDAVVTASSSNVITSGAVYNAIQSASGATITTLYDVDYFNTSIDIPAASYWQYDYLVFVLRYNSYGRMAKQTLILSQQEFSYIENGLEIVNQFTKATSGTCSGKYRFMEYSESTLYDIMLSYQQGPETLNVSHYSPGLYRNLIIIGVKE